MGQIIVYLENGRGEQKVVEINRSKNFALKEAIVQAGPDFRVTGWGRKGGLKRNGNKPWKDKFNRHGSSRHTPADEEMMDRIRSRYERFW